jgi:hypothetical protein
MNEYTLTCNCYEPPVRDRITVQAETLDEAWNKAKKKFNRKYKAKLADINITGVERH